MTDRRRKRKAAGDVQGVDPWKPTNDEAEVAKYLQQNLPATEGRLSGNTVRTFFAKDAVDLLMESAWAKVPNPSSDVTGKGVRKTRLFINQASVVEFLNLMLAKQMFHRAVLLKKTKLSLAGSKRPQEAKPPKTAKCKKSTDNKLLDPEDLSSKDQAGASVKEPAKEGEAGEPSARPITGNGTTTSAPVSSKSCKSATSRPPRLELHPEQTLVTTDDPDTVYVWIYEPPPGLFNWLAGTGLLLAIICCCLFPIWPASLRLGTYYLTLLASGLFGLMMAVALLRLVIYTVCWLVSLGGYSLWLFPNFFADCGFLDSFRPVVSFTPVVGAGPDRVKRSCKAGGKKVRGKVAGGGGQKEALDDPRAPGTPGEESCLIQQVRSDSEPVSSTAAS